MSQFMKHNTEAECPEHLVKITLKSDGKYSTKCMSYIIICLFLEDLKIL